MPDKSMIVNLVTEGESLTALDQQTRVLVNDFRRLEDVRATIPESAAPAGSRGDPVSVGTIVLAFVTGGGVTAIVQALSDWVKRGENRKVQLKMTLDGNTFEIEYPSKEVTEQELFEFSNNIRTLLINSKRHKG